MSETLEAGKVLAARYRVGKQLGQGGMGSVYLVEHVHTDEKLALKILHAAVVQDAGALERFRREARAPARIQSDHVVKVTDADVAPELDGAPFIVMEYLRGEDLDELVERRGALPPEEVLLYLTQVARALDKAHALGIVHRDLKPENLFLTTREDGAPWIKILDFGIAKLTGGAQELGTGGSQTSTGQIFGTPLFMSPEQAKAESAKISPQTDIWALGLIAYKMLTGKDIWSAQTITHLIAQIAYEPMPVPSERTPGLSPEFDAWFAKACDRDVAQRFATSGDCVAALARALGLPERAPIVVAPSAEASSAPARASDPNAKFALAATAVHGAAATPATPATPATTTLGTSITRSQAGLPPERSRGPMLAIGSVLALGVGVVAALFATGALGGSDAASAASAASAAASAKPKREPALAAQTAKTADVSPIASVDPYDAVDTADSATPQPTAHATAAPAKTTATPATKTPTTAAATAKPTVTAAPTAPPTAAPTAPVDEFGPRR